MGVCPQALSFALENDLTHRAPGCETDDFASQALTRSLLKKFRGSGAGGVDTRAVAIDAFKARVATCRLITQPVFYVSGILRTWLGYIEPEEVAEGMRYSSGSSVMMPERSTSGYAKHNLGAISASSLEVYKEYMGLLRDFDKPNFATALLRERRFGFHVDVPSNVTTVPKTNQIDRVIAVEPTANGFLQQGVKHCLEKRLLKVGIDLSMQPFLNQALARRGSLGHGLATIDLSNASDSISLRLLEKILPPDWFEYVSFVSNPSMRIDGATFTSENVPLTMGNAITFPLQTLIFLAICYEVYRRHDRADRKSVV